MTEEAEVRYEQSDGVVVITIDCPARGNSLGRTVRARLFEAWQDFEASDSAKVAILTGAGERFFCAGADLRELALESTGQPARTWAPVLGISVTVTKPTIAAVNGAAMGGGFLQAVMCDLVVAADTATFGISEARWGRGAPWALPLFRSFPPRALLELMLTASPMSAERAAAAGIANLVVPPAILLTTCQELAGRVSRNAPLSLAAAKEMSRLAQSGLPSDEQEARNEAIWASVYASTDAQIGPRAFADRITPQWTGT